MSWPSRDAGRPSEDLTELETSQLVSLAVQYRPQHRARAQLGAASLLETPIVVLMQASATVEHHKQLIA